MKPQSNPPAPSNEVAFQSLLESPMDQPSKGHEPMVRMDPFHRREKGLDRDFVKLRSAMVYLPT